MSGRLIPSAEDKQKGYALARTVAETAQGQRIMIFLDYDGTLAPITAQPENAVLPAEMRSALWTASSCSVLQLIVISGRSRSFLEKEFADLNVALAAEHGFLWKQAGVSVWGVLGSQDLSDKMREIAEHIEQVTDGPEGCFVERKEFCLSWHYRLAPEETGETAARTLEAHLKEYLAGTGLNVLSGKKVIEVRPHEADKGSFVRWYLSSFSGPVHPLLVAIGDDLTDEDMFREVISRGGIAVKIGEGETLSQYRLSDMTSVPVFLQELSAELKLRESC